MRVQELEELVENNDEKDQIIVILRKNLEER